MRSRNDPVQPPIPPAIRRFVLTSIASVPHLEALLLLRAAESQVWTAAQVAGRLYVGEAAALVLLDDLCHAAMLHCADGVYAYHPATPSLRATIDSLAELYARHLVDITHLIHSRLERQAQHFADAFRWRKET